MNTDHTWVLYASDNEGNHSIHSLIKENNGMCNTWCIVGYCDNPLWYTCASIQEVIWSYSKGPNIFASKVDMQYLLCYFLSNLTSFHTNALCKCVQIFIAGRTSCNVNQSKIVHVENPHFLCKETLMIDQKFVYKNMLLSQSNFQIWSVKPHPFSLLLLPWLIIVLFVIYPISWSSEFVL